MSVAPVMSKVDADCSPSYVNDGPPPPAAADSSPAVGQPAVIDFAAIEADLLWRLTRSSVIELRGIDPTRLRKPMYAFVTAANIKSAPTLLAKWNTFGYGCYATFNRNNASLPGMTKDENITGYAFLFVDAEANRPKGLQATDDDRARTLELVHRVAEFVTEHTGIAPCRIVDSGNGYHLYYKLDLPAESKLRVNALLKRLHAKFGSNEPGKIKIDSTVSNPARISRIAGTLNTKAAPSRVCRNLDTNSDTGTLTEADIGKLEAALPAATDATPQKTQKSAKKSKDPTAPTSFLPPHNQHALTDPLDIAEAWQRAKPWAAAILDEELGRSGFGGDGWAYSKLAAFLFGWLLTSELAHRAFMEWINTRLATVKDTWTPGEIWQKIAKLIDRGPRPGYPVGGLFYAPYKPPAGKKTRTPPGNVNGELAFSSLAGITPRTLTYLVPDFIPSGMLGMIAGEGGHGKSLIMLDLIAAVTTGGCPFGLDYADRVTGACVLIACEDDWERTIVPRLVARGADLSKVYRIEGLKLSDGGVLDFNLAHTKQLHEMIDKIGDVKLVVIDPAGAYVGRAGVDEHKDAELRSLLGPLSELANNTGATVLMVKHLNKNVGVSAVQRVGGSAGYVNAVRFSYIVTPDRDDATRKLFLPLKTNVLPGDLKGRAYRIAPTPTDEAHAVLEDRFPALSPADRAAIAKQLVRTEWDPTPVDIDANSATAGTTGRRPAGQLDACKVIIRTFLGDYSRPVEELDGEAHRAFPKNVVKEAKKQLRELPPGNPEKLWTRALKEGGKWWAWIGADATPRPPHPKPAGQSGPETAKADQTAGTDKTAPTDPTAPQGESCEFC